MFSIVVPVFVVAVFGYVSFTLFTQRGRRFSVTRQFGEILEDYGQVSELRTRGGTQRMSMLKCRKQADVFFVLQVTYTGPTSKSVRSIRIDPDTMARICSLSSQ